MGLTSGWDLRILFCLLYYFRLLSTGNSIKRRNKQTSVSEAVKRAKEAGLSLRF